MRKKCRTMLAFAMLGSVLALPISTKAETIEKEYNVCDFGANGEDTADDVESINDALEMACKSEEPIVVHIPKGTYYISKSLNLYSNTTLKLDAGATIRANSDMTEATTMVMSRHLNEDGYKYCMGSNCKHGGYTQIQNVTIDGGVWDRNKATSSVPTSIFSIRHGQNITIKNATLMNASEHFMNLSATSNVTIDNVILQDQQKCTSTSPDYWQDYAIGDSARFNTTEVIHLDYASTLGENSAYACPFDKTVCKDISITNCKFENVFSGVGNHHVDKEAIGDQITIKDCTFTGISSAHAILLYGFDNSTLYNNKFTNCGGMVRAKASTNLVVEKNTFTGDKGSKLYAVEYDEASEQGTIKNNTLQNIGEGAIRVQKGSTAAISGNTLKNGNKFGIFVSDSTAYTVENNKLTTFASYGIDIKVAKGSVKGNTLDNIGDSGIFISDSDAYTVESNKLKNMKKYGINIKTSKGTIKKNTITTSTDSAIFVSDSNGGVEDTTIDSNTVTSAKTYGINFKNAKGIIKNNKISKSGDTGIRAQEKSKVKVTGNTVESSTKNGIFISDADTGFVVEKNTVKTAGNYGLSIKGYGKSSVKNNTINGSKNYAIYAEGTGASKMLDLTLAGNKAYSSGNPKVDIRLGNYIKVTLSGNSTKLGIGCAEKVTIPKPALPTLSTSGTKITLKWPAVQGATKYRVYYKVNGKWTKLKDVTTNTYTTNKLKKGTSYTFSVQCLNNSAQPISSYDTKGKSIMCK